MASLKDNLRSFGKQVKYLGLPNYDAQIVLPGGTKEYTAPSDGIAYVGYFIPASGSVTIHACTSGGGMVLVAGAQQNVGGNTWWYSKYFRLAKGQRYSVSTTGGGAEKPTVTECRFYPDFG